jgi:hypothetical protein
MNYQSLHKNPKQFRSVSGLSHRDFTALHRDFAATWQHRMSSQTADEKPRRRRYSIRSDSVLQTTEDMLLFILSYLKNNPTQEYHASQWGMTQSQSHPWLRRCLRVLQETLLRSDMIPARTNIELLERLESMTPAERKGLRLDGTERPIERPCDDKKQREQYSGKKKRHTIKNLLLNTADKTVCFLSETFSGSVHDKRCADEIHFIMPDDTEMLQDTGFQGLTIPGVTSKQPTKKPRGKELTEAQKHENRAISQERITIEHSIGGVKVFRIVKDCIRLRSEYLRDCVMEICVGIYNFKNFRRKPPC